MKYRITLVCLLLCTYILSTIAYYYDTNATNYLCLLDGISLNQNGKTINVDFPRLKFEYNVYYDDYSILEPFKLKFNTQSNDRSITTKQQLEHYDEINGNMIYTYVIELYYNGNKCTKNYNINLIKKNQFQLVKDSMLFTIDNPKSLTYNLLSTDKYSFNAKFYFYKNISTYVPIYFGIKTSDKYRIRIDSGNGMIGSILVNGEKMFIGNIIQATDVKIHFSDKQTVTIWFDTYKVILTNINNYIDIRVLTQYYKSSNQNKLNGLLNKKIGEITDDFVVKSDNLYGNLIRY